MSLVIVESPTKAKTIQKLLKGGDFKILSSFGHVRDLPEKKLGINTRKDFEPEYVIPLKAKPKLKELKKNIPESKKVILATDEDREGEAIAYHLKEALNLKEENIKRIVFHEITKSAIEAALKNPRKINLDLVDAQQARRVLDRLVGYKLSPFLWRKVARGLSAGRVQSVAVRLICDKEKEIKKFKSDEYWTIVAILLKIKSQNSNLENKNELTATLWKKEDKIIPKLKIKNKEEADAILNDLKDAKYKISNIEKKEKIQNPLPPFTTSLLQQDAWRKFHFSAKNTMRIAQSLYERGFITYHRTDSFNLSDQSVFKAKIFIEQNYGKKYCALFKRQFKTKSKNAQEAHEAIRPTDPERTIESIEGKLEPGEKKLYDLIWRRFIASQMEDAKIDETIIHIEAKKYTFRADGQIIKFDGFLKVYPLQLKENLLPTLDKNEILQLLELSPFQHFTKPPARYSEATLIKILESHGIGRPSTYAPIISTIQERNYVEKDEKKKLKPTEIGDLVNNLLCEHFQNIVDLNFTAKMEEELDKIADGKLEWKKPIKNFYLPFKKNLEEKEKKIKKEDVAQEKTDKVCEKCKSPMVIKIGRFGRFLACTNYPECKETKQINSEGKIEEEKTDEICEKCKNKMVIKHGRFGTFLGCSDYPKCKNIKTINKTIGMKCPDCKNGDVIEKKTKKGRLFYGCSDYPKCKFASWQKPSS